MSALSDGFASVVGTPFAATLFGLEVLAIGTINHYALFPCLVAAAVGDRITLVLGLCYKYFCPCQLPVINIFATCQ
jgi:H+/Cl- antiporter ClcA